LHSYKRSLLRLGTLAVIIAGIVAVPSGAHADNGPLPGSFGYDISYPQCPSNLPGGTVGFAIIGVNGGRAMTENRCLSSQLAWARKGDVAPAVYVNTNSPPQSYSSALCSTSDNVCRAHQYGRQAAQYALTYVGKHSPAVDRYWLDVETMNTWSPDTVENAAVLRGMIEVLTAEGKTVGIYSTNYQFTRIAGRYSPGLDNWVPRPEARRETAGDFCRSSPSFGGGRVVMIQLWYTFDENYACPSQALPPPSPARPLQSGDRAVVAPGVGCLNLRGGTGVTFPILDCMKEGMTVSVTGSPVTRGQYNWVPISSSSGVAGWAAADYLTLAPVRADPPLRNRVVVVNVAGG